MSPEVIDERMSGLRLWELESVDYTAIGYGEFDLKMIKGISLLPILNEFLACTFLNSSEENVAYIKTDCT